MSNRNEMKQALHEFQALGGDVPEDMVSQLLIKIVEHHCHEGDFGGVAVTLQEQAYQRASLLEAMKVVFKSAFPAKLPKLTTVEDSTEQAKAILNHFLPARFPEDVQRDLVDVRLLLGLEICPRQKLGELLQQASSLNNDEDIQPGLKLGPLAVCFVKSKVGKRCLKLVGEMVESHAMQEINGKEVDEVAGTIEALPDDFLDGNLEEHGLLVLKMWC